jgi:hypothetical protein
MKKKLSIYSLSIILLLCLLFSCDNKDEDIDKNNPNQNINKLLINKAWHLTECYAFPIFGSDSSIFNDVNPCIKDDIYIFFEDSSFNINNGKLKCKTTDPDLVIGKWRIFNDSLSLNNLNYKLLFYDDNKMQLTYKLNISNNNFTYKYIYTAK